MDKAFFRKSNPYIRVSIIMMWSMSNRESFVFLSVLFCTEVLWSQIFTCVDILDPSVAIYTVLPLFLHKTQWLKPVTHLPSFFRCQMTFVTKVILPKHHLLNLYWNVYYSNFNYKLNIHIKMYLNVKSVFLI